MNTATWSRTPPTEVGLWQWKLFYEDEPVELRITQSSVTGNTFAPDYRPGTACKHFGGWWLRAEVPEPPATEE